MRYRLAVLVLVVSLGGCGPKLSRADLGTVIFESPKVAGSDQPYQMPQLAPHGEQNAESPGQPLP